MVLSTRGQQKVTELAEVQGVSPATASRAIDRVLAAGLVDRQPNPHSRREVHIRLTKAGEQVVRAATGADGRRSRRSSMGPGAFVAAGFRSFGQVRSAGAVSRSSDARGPVVTVAAPVALVFAVVGAVGYGAGSVAQALAARRATGTLHTLRQPLYLAGLGCDLVAWLASLVALRTLAVYQVQAVLAGSLAVTVVGARVVLGARLRRRDGVAVAVTVVALVVLALSAGPQDQIQVSGAVRWGLVTAAVLVAVAGWVTARAGSPGVSATLAGLAFGGAALCARALPLSSPARDLPAFVGALAAEPLTWGLVVLGVAGMLLYTHALQHGQVGPVTAVLWIVEVIAPSVIGIAVLHDSFRAGWTVYAVVAVLATTAAAAVLATAPATAATQP